MRIEAVNTSKSAVNAPNAGSAGTRAEKVAHAKKLLADPNYPSQELLAKISALLAKSLRSADF